MRTKKTVLFVRCSYEEAKKIRHAATRERRTISSFILNTVLNGIEEREQLARMARSNQKLRRMASSAKKNASHRKTLEPV